MAESLLGISRTEEMCRSRKNRGASGREHKAPKRNQVTKKILFFRGRINNLKEICSYGERKQSAEDVAEAEESNLCCSGGVTAHTPAAIDRNVRLTDV